jgi:hypothetical protein
MKTAIDILTSYQKEVEKYFLVINKQELEKIYEELSNCKKEEIPELKAKIRLIEDYLFRNVKELTKDKKIVSIQVAQEIDLSKYDNAHSVVIAPADKGNTSLNTYLYNLNKSKGADND